MKVYIERTVSPPLEADQVRDKSKVGQAVRGEPFRVLDLTEDGLMTLSAAEQAGRVWFAEHGESQSEEEAPLDELTVRFHDATGDARDLVLTVRGLLAISAQKVEGRSGSVTADELYRTGEQVRKRSNPPQ